ncbi:MAG: sulfatase-like hydrolase/transferase, partial [Burkholderiales bacterium]|nr:sulfatase-like hydrolase/transferase [Burkholderiales bacterium]
FLGCYGHPVLRTPNIDSIAARGTAFDRFHVASPVCMPNRSSLMTGRMPSLHGVRSNGIPLSMDAVTFVELLRDAGYRTALIGKSHLQNFTPHAPVIKRPPPRPGFHEPSPPLRQAVRNDLHEPQYEQETPEYWMRDGASVRTPFYGFEHVTLVRAHGDEPGGDYDRWLDARDPNARKLLGPKNSLPHDYVCPQAFRTAIPEELYATAFLGERACAWLDEADPNAPFFLMVSFPDPHHPFDAPEPWSRLHHPDEVDLPMHRTKDLERRPWWHKASLEGKPQLTRPDMVAHRAKGSRVPEQTDEQLRHLIANYYGMISLIDHNVGRIFNALADYGLAEDTIVIYTTDHGDWLGDHGLILKGPMMYEGLLRVGMIFKGPGVPAGKVVADPVATTDLAATFCDYCGVDAGRDLHGRSLRRVMAGEETRDYAYNEWKLHPSRTGLALDLRCVRTRDAKLTLERSSGAGELYRLADDPHEMDNLFGNPDYATLQKELTDMIRARPDDVASVLPEPIGMA